MAPRPTAPPVHIAPPTKPTAPTKPGIRDLMPYKTTPRGIPLPLTTPPSLRPQCAAEPAAPPPARYIVPDPDNQKLHFGTPVGKGRVDGNIHPQGGEINVTVPVGK